MARLAPLSMPVRGGGGNDGNARRAAAQDGQDQAVHSPTKEEEQEQEQVGVAHAVALWSAEAADGAFCPTLPHPTF